MTLLSMKRSKTVFFFYGSFLLRIGIFFCCCCFEFVFPLLFPISVRSWTD